MSNRSKRSVLLILASLVITSTSLYPAWAARGHRSLEQQNHFKTAREVLEYFVDRDSEGFLWSGLLESERAEFTTWKSSPAADSFYVARKMELRPQGKGDSGDTQVIDVVYDLESVRDSAGTTTPPPDPKLTVRYLLRKTGGKWKISEPDASRFTPVLLLHKLPN